jgi:hypothetical protein
MVKLSLLGTIGFLGILALVVARYFKRDGPTSLAMASVASGGAATTQKAQKTKSSPTVAKPSGSREAVDRSNEVLAAIEQMNAKLTRLEAMVAEIHTWSAERRRDIPRPLRQLPTPTLNQPSVMEL